eukprot:scaffold269_cov404-Prasinococcus_capsulatus_cf.AAC.30
MRELALTLQLLKIQILLQAQLSNGLALAPLPAIVVSSPTACTEHLISVGAHKLQLPRLPLTSTRTRRASALCSPGTDVAWRESAHSLACNSGCTDPLPTEDEQQ